MKRCLPNRLISTAFKRAFLVKCLVTNRKFPTKPLVVQPKQQLVQRTARSPTKFLVVQPNQQLVQRTARSPT